MDYLASIEDPDEMLENAAFHQGLHCLLRLKSSGTDIPLNFEKNLPVTLDIYNEPFQGHCFKPDGRIH